MSHISVDALKAPCITGMSPLGFPISVHQFELIYTYGETAEIKAQLAWMEEVRLSRSLLADIPLMNFAIGYREAVRLFNRHALCMLTSLQ